MQMYFESVKNLVTDVDTARGREYLHVSVLWIFVEQVFVVGLLGFVGGHQQAITVCIPSPDGRAKLCEEIVEVDIEGVAHVGSKVEECITILWEVLGKSLNFRRESLGFRRVEFGNTAVGG